MNKVLSKDSQGYGRSSKSELEVAAMHITRNVLAVIALSALAGSSIGQESQQPAPAPAKPAAESPAPAKPPASAPAGADTQQKPTAPPEGADAQAKPQQKMPIVKDDEFIPTQELQGDEEVTFPVDI
jgi:hypothetical protein